MNARTHFSGQSKAKHIRWVQTKVNLYIHAPLFTAANGGSSSGENQQFMSKQPSGMTAAPILDCPIVCVNVRVWHFWSFVLKHDAMRYVSIIPVGVMNVFMFADLYRAWGNIDENYEEITSIEIVMDYKLLSQMIDDYVVQKLANLVLRAVISICYVVYPLFTGTRSLPYGMFIPGVNNFKAPLYQVFFIGQAVLTFPGCCMYIPFTSFFATTTLFGLVQIQTLQRQLRTFKDEVVKENRTLVESKLEKCIEDHKRISRYVSDVNSLVTYICLIEFMSFGLMLCALLFLLNIIFTFYWHANELREESMGIAEAAYDAPWVELDDSMKKKLLLFIARAQQPLEAIGNVYAMTLAMFQSRLNASYSYFTLL
ncbi:odorant receptor [Culex quinquefasciatus]|uniref:Odorant receptor n=1 Tax=Culex quinquefasciatus TaxID=7176 RepID=B0X4H0_CULQU|nr:odorant receptor [Culex quinquefasciatus]|eukprot:XP_001864542.1 odorant receptor [Culex quinquefasciatus]